MVGAVVLVVVVVVSVVVGVLARTKAKSGLGQNIWSEEVNVENIRSTLVQLQLAALNNSRSATTGYNASAAIVMANLPGDFFTVTQKFFTYPQFQVDTNSTILLLLIDGNDTVQFSYGADFGLMRYSPSGSLRIGTVVD